MQSGINSSFIPKKDIARKQKKKSSFGTSVFLLIGVIIFLATLLAALGVFLYDKKLEADNRNDRQQLEKSQDDLGIQTFKQYIDLSNRIKAADDLLVQHVDVTPIFTLLENSTLTEIYLSDFSFQTEGSVVQVAARGNAPSYRDIALQSREYGGEQGRGGVREGGNNDMKEVLLSNVNQSRDGGVQFDLSFLVNTDTLLVR